MKKITTIIIFCFFIAYGNAQTFGGVTNVGGGGGNNTVVSHLLGDIKKGNEKRSIKKEGIQGSAYTSEVFLPGALHFKGNFESNIFYRYNAYAEELEIKDVNLPGAPIRGLNRDKNISLITPDGKAISFKTFIDRKGLTQNGYLTKLAEGKYSFYERYDVKYTQPQKAQNSFVPAQPARFSKFTEYYIELEGRNRIDELELSNRKLIKSVDDNQKEALKLFLKENKLKIKDKNDVYKVLNFLNK